MSCLKIVQSAELTVDISSYSYRELDQNGNFFMEDKSAPLLYGVGIRDWGDDKGSLKVRNSNWMLLYTLEYNFGNIDYTSAGTGTMKKQYYKKNKESKKIVSFSKYNSLSIDDKAKYSCTTSYEICK